MEAPTIMISAAWDPIIERFAGYVPVAFIRALIHGESGGDSQKENPTSHAAGLLQITDIVRRDWNSAHPEAPVSRADLFDPEINVRIGAALLNRIVQTYRRHPTLAPDWKARRYPELIALGWNAGYSDRGGVGLAAARLEAAGAQPDDVTSIRSPEPLLGCPGLLVLSPCPNGWPMQRRSPICTWEAAGNRLSPPDTEALRDRWCWPSWARWGSPTSDVGGSHDHRSRRRPSGHLRRWDRCSRLAGSWAAGPGGIHRRSRKLGDAAPEGREWRTDPSGDAGGPAESVRWLGTRFPSGDGKPAEGRCHEGSSSRTSTDRSISTSYGCAGAHDHETNACRSRSSYRRRCGPGRSSRPCGQKEANVKTFYDSGLSDVGGRLFSVLSPSAIKQEIDSVDHYIRRIDGDVQAHRVKVADILQDWHLFVQEWTAFRDGADWMARTTGATYDKALDYRKRADAWDELVHRRGASTAPVGTTPAPAPTKDLAGSFVKLAGIGLAAYVGVSLFQIYKNREMRHDARSGA